ncbi:TetR/AcrR family transcriptional regulator [Piscinibacter koreensis]|uniref:TetR/AcrR family transcriptional regulator n=1 Tax=Piscinibacter koreensis TaxID=2742824 RepID=A0A7Y6NQ99_9BURK|nr:TetR/AcrR family transcriptional regulator [Schlegelella koreensis]NUZ07351.1 TetR/AcrR family transcriptional regulator [Schlegelella koreensis]
MPRKSSPHAAPSRRDLTHARILDIAAREVRAKGYERVGVADVMKQAGLTHGGFYAHFPSRDAMLAEAIEHAGRTSAGVLAERIEARRPGVSAFAALVGHYLSEAHLAGPERGCVVAALASEMARQPAALADAATTRVRSLIATVERALPPGSPADAATTVAATLVGSLQIARALGADGGGKAVLAAARQTLIAQYDVQGDAAMAAGSASNPPRRRATHAPSDG